MKNRFFVPAVTFLTALIVWVTFFVAHLMDASVQEWAPWVTTVLSLGVGCLMLLSAVSCHRAGGPRVGGFVRSSMLLIMALLTFWKVGAIAAGIMLALAILIAVGVYIANRESSVGI
jgi:hypothetical protein